MAKTSKRPSEIAPAGIVVHARARKVEPDVDSLRQSIERIGLINPITVTADGESIVLVAGETRLRAWTAAFGPDKPIPVRFLDDLAPAERLQIELEENIKRTNMAWPDEARAIKMFNDLCLERDAEWSWVKTSEALAMDRSLTYKIIRLAEFLDTKRASALAGCPNRSTAIAAMERIAERDRRIAEQHIEAGVAALPVGAVPDVQDLVGQMLGKPAATPAPVAAEVPDSGKNPLSGISAGAPASYDIVCGSFLDWIEEYSGPPFSFIHCDFPYGEDYQKSKLAKNYDDKTYADNKEIFNTLFERLCQALPTLSAPQAHLMFWCRSDIGTLYRVQQRLLEVGGWRVCSVPLIWYRSDNRGILPDPERQPRRIYETALFAARGDRRIFRSVSNLQGAATDKSVHPSHKPTGMLRRFFEMFVDPFTRVLDPTCGSGGALEAALGLGARHATGVELDEEYAGIARAAARKGAQLRHLENVGSHVTPEPS